MTDEAAIALAAGVTAALLLCVFWPRVYHGWCRLRGVEPQPVRTIWGGWR